jgi:hypothetical protein
MKSFLVENITAMTVTKPNFEKLSCYDFYIPISNNLKLLQELVHLKDTRNLSKRKEQCLQYQLENNFN